MIYLIPVVIAVMLAPQWLGWRAGKGAATLLALVCASILALAALILIAALIATSALVERSEMHDTYYVVGHFHYALYAVGLLLVLVGFTYAAQRSVTPPPRDLSRVIALVFAVSFSVNLLGPVVAQMGLHTTDSQSFAIWLNVQAFASLLTVLSFWALMLLALIALLRAAVALALGR